MHVRQPLLIIGIVFSLLLFFRLFQSARENSTSRNQTDSTPSPVVPVRLIIPKINVDAVVESVGLTPSGTMQAPTTIANVGWFNLGPHPGERGSAVIAGHFNGKNGEAGVFINLYQLNAGDNLFIEDDQGIFTTFVVRESRLYNPGYAEEVFSSNDMAHLNLITCDGVWDSVNKSYSKRLVIFADIVP